MGVFGAFLRMRMIAVKENHLTKIIFHPDGFQYQCGEISKRIRKILHMADIGTMMAVRIIICTQVIQW
jgi:hypothetical protein